MKWSENKKSFIGAREIWIFCVENGLNVPEDFMLVFTDGVRKEHEKYELKHPGRPPLGNHKRGAYVNRKKTDVKGRSGAYST